MDKETGTSISASGERSRRWRERMSEEKREKNKKTDKDCKQAKRANMTEEEKEEIRKKNRENMAKKRAEKKKKEEEEKEIERKKNLYVSNEREHNREYKKRKAEEMSEEEAEFVRIEQMLRRKKSRANHSEEEHQNDKIKAMKGMQKCRELGYLKEFKNRETWFASRTEEEIWRIYLHSSHQAHKLLELRKPEVVEAIKKKEAEEQKRRDDKNRENDEWMQECAPPGFVWRNDWQGGDYHWAGEGPQPKETMEPGYWTADLQKMNPEVTEEDEKRWKDQEEKWLREEILEMKDQERKEHNAYMKKYRDMTKAKLLEPIQMPKVEGEKSEYLLLQEKNIKELEDRKKMSGLFDD